MESFRFTEGAPRSFRDPGGFVFREGERLLRFVNREHVAPLDSFLATSCAQEAIASRSLVETKRLEAGASAFEHDGEIYEHERINFPSYPAEWPPQMLGAAAALTLSLFQKALPEGFGLKDATPYNILFRGTRPVFVDLLSFERRNPRDATWISYAQFVRMFLLPLAAWTYFRISGTSIFTASREGLEPDQVYQWSGWWRRWTPPLLGLITIPRLLSGRTPEADYTPKQSTSPEKARFILENLLNSCQRQLRRLNPSTSPDSRWTDYLDHKSLYSSAQLAQKEAFVREALEEMRPTHVLDVGTNEGHFSVLAARHHASVVAIDSDPAVVGKLWLRASQEDLDILPLVVDLARPTPAVGWRNEENESFLQRASGRFDLVLMLAVVHHMLVAERIPLEDILSLVGDLTCGYAIIEFISPEDPMFQRIVRGRQALYAHLTFTAFETAALRRFEVLRSVKLEGLHRCLYLLRRRPHA